MQFKIGDRVNTRFGTGTVDSAVQEIQFKGRVVYVRIDRTGVAVLQRVRDITPASA